MYSLQPSQDLELNIDLFNLSAYSIWLSKKLGAEATRQRFWNQDSLAFPISFLRSP